MKHKWIIAIFICILLIMVFCVWQNNHIVVSDYTFTSDKVGKSFDGFKIVQVSDLHNKRFGKAGKRLLSRIEAEDPDMIVVTGDLVDSNHTDLDKAMEFIEGAVKLAPVYYVTGNHEKWLDADVESDLFGRLERAGVICINDEKREISSGGESFTLIGLDDGSLLGNTLSSLMRGEEEHFTVLLAHEPQLLAQYSSAKVDLVLSGHAHGGQVRLPVIGGLVAPDQGFFPQYTEGLYTEKNASMYVSRGLGNSIIPLRVFNFPEVVVVTLRSTKQ